MKFWRRTPLQFEQIRNKMRYERRQYQSSVFAPRPPPVRQAPYLRVKSAPSLLDLLGAGEPRGLPGATARAVRFQQSAHGRPLDDITIDAVNGDRSERFSISRRSAPSISRVATPILPTWLRCSRPHPERQFTTARYEMAVAIAQTSTRIERDCRQVLEWSRRLANAG